MRLEHATANTPARRLFGLYHRGRRTLNRILQQVRGRRDPLSLNRYEEEITSQNGEDGVLREIFRRLGTENGYFVEFGSSDGHECCTRHLLVNGGWQGLWIEGSEAAIDRARAAFGELPIRIEHAFVTRENICALLERNQVPHSPDLLVVDIDGNDYWVLETILARYHPAVLVCEYNASFGPRTDWVMPYAPEHKWDYTLFQGASLSALERLAARHGYALAGCESMGVNAFFLDRSLGEGKFTFGRTTGYYYRAPKYGDRHDFGHPLFPGREDPGSN